MRLIRLISQSIVLVCLFAITTGYALATSNLQADSFDVYINELDGEIYFKAKEKILLISSDISIPIIYQDSESLMVTGEGVNATIQPAPDNVDMSNFEPVDFDLFFGDFNGDGITDILFKGKNNIQQSMIVYGASSSVPSNVYAFRQLEGLDVYSQSLVIQDRNQDGRDDILIVSGEFLITVAYASTAGEFSESVTVEPVNLPKTSLVGATPGAFNVSQSGAATFSVPIKLPPAVGGMAPNLSLRYSSQSGNGLLGLGWQVNGISYITRCSTNYERDGQIDGVNFNDNDQYCLGGQRLIPILGVNGSDGTEYRTEIDTYKKIVSYGVAVHGPQKFKVHSKDDSVSEYGYTNDSQIESQNGKGNIVWALNKKTDRSENAYTVEYFEDTAEGEWRIDRINLNVNSTNNTYVKFNYEPRTDIRKRHYSGGFFQSSKLLDTLDVWVDGEANYIRQYDFTYHTKENDYDLSTLSSLVECDASNNCLPEVKFDWLILDEAITQDPHFVSKKSAASSFSDVNGWGDVITYSTIKYVDVTGDGFVDICGKFTAGIYCSINQKDGTFAAYTQWTSSFGTWIEAHKYRTITFVDVTGDGLADVCGKLSGGISCAENSGENSFINYKPWTSEFNKDDNWDDEHKYSTLTFVDVTGDGLADVCGKGSTGIWCAENSMVLEEREFTNYQRWTEEFNTDRNWDREHKYTTLRFIDVTGDGLADVCGKASSGIKCAVNSGNQTFEDYKIWFSVFNTDGNWDDAHKYSSVTFIDVTGDGLVDVCGKPNTGIKCAINTGGEKFEESTYSEWLASFTLAEGWDQVARYSSIRFVDVTGDGFPDVCGRSTTGVECAKNNYLAHSKVKSISTANNTTNIQYNLLTDSAVYSKQSGLNGADAIIQIQPASYVASQIESSNGIGGLNTTTYQYEGFRYHIPARKSLGFAKVSSTDLITGNRVERIYSQDYENRTHGMLKQEIIKASNGTELSNATYKFLTNKRTSSEVPGFIYEPYVEKVTKITKDHSGIVTNDTVIDIVKSTDGYGDLQSRTEKNRTLGNAVPDFNETFTYKRGVANNQLISQVDTHVQTSGDKTRTTKFSNYDSNGRLKTLIIEPNDQPLNIFYGYDDFGNIDRVVESAVNMATRETITDYDMNGLYVNYAENAEKFKDFTVTAYDKRFGQPTAVLDANNQLTEIAYDALGRIIWQKNPDNTELTVGYQWCSTSSVYCQTNELYAETTTASGQAPITRYFDSFNRELRNTHSGFDGGLIYQKFSFNEIGGIASVSEPYTGNAPTDSTITEYDTLWRAFKTINPDGSSREITDFNGLEITERNELNQYKTTKYDPLGRVWKTTDAKYTETDFVYGGFGNLEQTSVAGTYSLITYDNRGRKTSMTSDANGPTDVTAPRYDYTYNAFGEMITQTDPNGSVTCYAYDKLGRMTKRTDNYQGNLTTQAILQCAYSSILQKVNTWEYDTAINGNGLLHKVKGPQNYEKAYSYDQVSRLETESTTIGLGVPSYDVGYGYNEINGFHDLTLYPEGFSTVKHYKNTGHLQEIANAVDQSKVYYKATGMTVRDQVSHFTYGNGLASVNDYNADTGRLESTQSRIGTVGNLVLDRSYRWDALGNLNARKDIKAQLDEDFTYDNLNRLETTTYTNRSNASPITTINTMQYYDNGNIDYKPGVGTYSYGAVDSSCSSAGNAATRVSAYAVSQILGTKNTFYCYDKNGNTLSGDGRTMQYNTNNQPTKIIKGDNVDVSDLLYDPSGTLYQRTDAGNSSNAETTYIGGLYEKEVKGSTTKHKFYVDGFAVVTQTNSNVSSRVDTYLHHDHLGSVVLVTDASGNEDESFSFDAWGKRRSVIDYTSTVTLTEMITTQQGFTGHQQMDNVGLIHMKGRVYDPTIGRFLSQDPFVQAPTNSQSFNRYTYVSNSPLSFTDPTGYNQADDMGEDSNHPGHSTRNTSRDNDRGNSPTYTYIETSYGTVTQVDYHTTGPWSSHWDEGWELEVDDPNYGSTEGKYDGRYGGGATSTGTLGSLSDGSGQQGGVGSNGAMAAVFGMSRAGTSTWTGVGGRLGVLNPVLAVIMGMMPAAMGDSTLDAARSRGDVDGLFISYRAPKKNELALVLTVGFTPALYPGNGVYLTVDPFAAGEYASAYGAGVLEVSTPYSAIKQLYSSRQALKDPFVKGAFHVLPSGIPAFNESSTIRHIAPGSYELYDGFGAQ